jgi:hypothetical protein
LALAISHAYPLGRHRSQTDIPGMDPSVTEMSRRVWWCLYILDRRLAIEGGHLFLISDRDVDTPLPRLSDGDLGVIETKSTRPTSLQPEASSGPTPILYFIAMAEYLKVPGKVWEAVYSAGTGSNPNPSLCEHLETLLFGVQNQIPPMFRYRPQAGPNGQPATAPWWLIKQQSLMQIVCVPGPSKKKKINPRLSPPSSDGTRPTATDIRTSASYGSSPVHGTKHMELSVVEDFDWLYALFGDYLDLVLIDFQ